MDKKVLLAVVAGTVTLGVVYFVNRKKVTNTSSTNSSGATPQGSLLGQLGGVFAYPFRMGRQADSPDMTQPSTASAQRVVQNVGPNDSQGMRGAAAQLGYGTNIVQSLSDVWGNVSDWWGHDEAGDASLDYADNPLPANYDFYMPAASLDASNNVQDAFYDDSDDGTGTEWSVA